MFVELNDKAFYKANEGDIFSIQIIHNKKFAAPISKQELLDAELKRISLLEQEVDRLKQEKQKLQEENEELKLENVILTELLKEERRKVK